MTDIPITANERKAQFTGNTGLGPFAFTFNILTATDIRVIKNSTTLTITTHYTVTINGDGTGSITLTGSGSGAALNTSDVLTIIGNRSLARTSDYVQGGNLFAGALNEDLDSIVIMMQQLDEKISRTLRVNAGDVGENLLMPLKDVRAGKLLSFDTEGNPTATSSGEVATGSVLGANYVTNTALGDGSRVAFGLTQSPGSKNNVQVYIDGVYQNKASFSISGPTLTFGEAPPVNSLIEFIIGAAVGSISADANSIIYNQGGTGAQERTVQSRLRDFVSVKDFGAVGDGVTDDTTALTNAIAATASSEYGLSFEAGKNYLVSAPLSFSNSGNTVPRWVDFNGCAITASGSFSGSSVVYVENPQGKVDTFWMSNAYIDATGVNYGFYLKGGQDGRYSSLQVVNAVSHGFLIQGETGFGIYYNVFDTCKAGGPSGGGNGGDGFRISGVVSRFANSNTFVNCASQYNAEGGFRVGISSGNTFIGCTAEENVADAGFVFGDSVTSVSIIGGFTENNIYSAADTSFRILSGSAVDNVRISGGRHNGTTNGDFTQDGIMYDTTGVGDVTIWNTDLKIRNLTLGGTGANIVSADATSIRFGDTLNPDANLTYNLGSNALRWTTVFCNDIDQNSTTGGTGSAGAGKQYITLRIDGVNYKLLHDGTV